MEILGGSGKGMQLKVPTGLEVRPTAVRSRRALFDMLGDLSGKCFCDLFAGSGAMAIEAASRGASHVILVERSPHVLAAIKDNVRKAQVWSPDTFYQIIPGTIPDCFKKIASGGTASPDIIFADPPYAESAALLDALLCSKDFTAWFKEAVMLWEMPDYRTDLKVFPDEWRLDSIRELGASRFLVIRKKTEN